MDAASPSPSVVVAPPPVSPVAPATPPQASPQALQPPAIVAAWPRSAQLTTAFLLGACTALLAVQIMGSMRWGARPAELERAAPAYRIDLNRASRAELLQVPGVGPALAERIEDYREKHGPFQSVDQLMQVRGIGPATLERVRPWFRAGGDETVDELPPAVVRRTSKPASSAMDGDQRKTAGKKETALASPIDINKASAADLQRLSGIGPVLSQRIIDERSKRPFKSVDDLRRVGGIG